MTYILSLLTNKSILVVAAILICIASVYAIYRRGQSVGYEKAKTEYTHDLLLATQRAREKEIKLTKQLQEAQNGATARNKKIAKLSNGINASSSRVRDTIKTVRDSLSSASSETLHNNADTALQLFGECQSEYSKVAEAAQRHASDAQLLEEAWPN